ncbi:MAG: DMT family transporter [Pseudomonadota bacterium]
MKHGRFHRPMVGATLACTAMSLFAIQDAVIKLLSQGYSLFQILFSRSIVVVLILFVWLYRQKGLSTFRTSRVKDHALRVTFNFTAFLIYYFALSRLPLSVATAIALSSPLFLTALSGPLLGEPADFKRKLILATGFAGVLIVIQPNELTLDWIGVVAAVFGAFMFAMLGIQTRKMSATENTDLMVFYGSLVFLIITSMTLPFNWITPSSEDWVLLLSVGLITLFAQYAIVHAYQFAPVYVLAPFEYVIIIWAIVLGWLMFSEIPTAAMLSGSAVIIVCGLLVARMERMDAESRH